MDRRHRRYHHSRHGRRILCRRPAGDSASLSAVTVAVVRTGRGNSADNSSGGDGRRRGGTIVVRGAGGTGGGTETRKTVVDRRRREIASA